jgi:hypothetical protein
VRKRPFEAVEFQVKHLDRCLVATSSTELSLDKVQKSVKESEELDDFQGRGGLAGGRIFQ